MYNLGTLLFIIASLVSFELTASTSKVNCILKSLVGKSRKYSKGTNGIERAIEFETSLNMVLDYTTTPDGRLGSLLKAAYGKFYNELGYGDWFVSKFGENFSEVKWSSLNRKQKKEILNYITEEQEFFSNRKIPGLRLKSTDHPFSEFENYIELGEPKSAGNVKLVELHLRGKKRAAELALKVRKAAREEGVKGGVSIHAHIPFKIRLKQLKESPFIESAKTADFYRRTEIFSEITSLMHINDDLADVIVGNAANFHTMKSPEEVASVWKTFFYKGKASDLFDLELYSKNYVGIRGEGVYDEPGLWGLEPRALFARFSDEQTAAILNGIESSGGRQDFGLDSDRVQKWIMWNKKIGSEKLKRLGIKDMERLASKLFPDFSTKTFSPKNLSPEELTIWKKLQFKKISKRWRLILHDWSEDLLFYDKPELIEKIKIARIRAMRRHLKGEEEIQITRAFFAESGVYDAFSQSLGIELRIR